MLPFCMFFGATLGCSLGWWLIGALRKSEHDFEKFVMHGVTMMCGGTMLFAALLSLFATEGDGIVKWSGLVFGGAFFMGGLISAYRVRPVPAKETISASE